jgi:hypothetical protein
MDPDRSATQLLAVRSCVLSLYFRTGSEEETTWQAHRHCCHGRAPRGSQEQPVLVSLEFVILILCLTWVSKFQSVTVSWVFGIVVNSDLLGSAFIWLSWIPIRNCIGNADPKGPGAWKLQVTKIYKYTCFPAVQESFLYLRRYAGSGSAWIRIGLAPWSGYALR